ncbi:MAG: hypothetical protein OXU40_05670 [Nitrospira sp.]|nr:hypothetical protein [Nitrospira sp.]
MHRFITKIGKGQQGARDLSWEETKQATHDLIESMPLNSTRGRATPCQIGAFLMAMRIKLESVTELAACTATTRSYAAALEAPAHLNVVDVPVYAEKHNTFHVCLPAAIVAAAAGATILFHGVDNPSVDSDLPRILKQLGIPWELRGAELLATLEQNGLAYLDLALYHPPLAQFVALREELGAQNMFHQVARLLNPARARSQVVGVAHPQYLKKIPEAVAMLGGHRLLVFQGLEGFPELSMTTSTIMRERRQDRVTPLTLTPQDAHLPPGTFPDMALPSRPPDKALPAREAALIHDLLNNRVRDRSRDWVIYNAAMLIYASGQASSVAAGVPLARRGLESGAAAHKLAALTYSPTPDQTVVHA